MADITVTVLDHSRCRDCGWVSPEGFITTIDAIDYGLTMHTAADCMPVWLPDE